MLQAAYTAQGAGFNVIPILADGTKRPAAKWKRWQNERQSQEQVASMFDDSTEGYALLCGEVSGGLELLDFDEQGMLERFELAAQERGIGDLVARIRKGYHEETPAPGDHLAWRCPTVEGNTKLAQRLKAPHEQKNEHDRTQVLIETRGEGGYFIAAPSGGRTRMFEASW